MIAKREAHHAQIIVGAVGASDQVFSRKLYSGVSEGTEAVGLIRLTIGARVASMQSVVCGVHIALPNFGRLLPLLRCDGFRDTADQKAVLNSSFDEPMTFSVTGHISCDA